MSDGHATWWVNRKSRMGLKPSAKPPPFDPKKPWWTTPPIAPPEPELMEYVFAYHAEVVRKLAAALRQHERDECHRLLSYLKEWLRAARRLYHERVMETVQHPDDDLSTTDGILLAAGKSLGRLRAQVVQLGGEISPRDSTVGEALMRRNDTNTHRIATRMKGRRP